MAVLAKLFSISQTRTGFIRKIFFCCLHLEILTLFLSRRIFLLLRFEKILNLKNIKKTFLSITGAPLQEQWVLQDIGITSGSNIKCTLKTVEKPKLIVYLAYNQETITITEDIDPINVSLLSPYHHVDVRI